MGRVTAKPTYKTINRLHQISDLLKDNPEASDADLIPILSDMWGGVSARRVSELLQQRRYLIDKGDLSPDGNNQKKNQVVQVHPSVLADGFDDTINPDVLPNTEEELKAYRYKLVLSPAAKAMRIQALVDASTNEKGIAQQQALDRLEQITLDYDDTTGEAEYIFFDVYDEESGGFLPSD